MRTLKKTLCLVLCLAMMVGLCAMATSAVSIDDYKDKEDIQYEEAVTLLSALGVLEGYPDETFKPKGELNRAEGAAIMTRLLTKTVPTGTSSFTDMGNYAWAQPYVKFCEDYGIIHGYEDGTFKPAEKLSTTAFAKMLICALGYDAKEEGFVDDPAWAINVTKKVTGLNLADGLAGYSPIAAVTRETAAQLAFNTLFQTMVYSDGISYQFNGGMYAGFVTLKNGAPVPNTSYDYMPTDPDNVMQFIEAAFPEVKVRTMDDAFAVPTNYWYKGKNAQDKTFSAKKVIAETIACDVLGRYAAGIDSVTSGTIFNDALFEGKSDDVCVYENGDYLGTLTVTNKGRARVIAGYAGAEAILLDYPTYDKYGDVISPVRLVVKYPYLAEVVSEKPGENRSIGLKVYKGEGDTINPIIVNYETEDYKEGDFVLVYPKGLIADTSKAAPKDFVILLVTDPVANNGTLNKVYLDTSDAVGTAVGLTIAKDDYAIAADPFAKLGPDEGLPVSASKFDYILGTGITAYTNFGYVLGVVSDAVSYADWVFLVGKETDIHTSPFGDKTIKVGYVKQDATTSVDELYGEEPEYKKWASPFEVGKKTGFNYPAYLAVNDYAAELTKNKDGVPQLKYDQPELGMGDTYKIIADSKTTFVLRTDVGFFAYTGILNVPTFKGTQTGDKGVYALVPAKGTFNAHAIAVYIDVRGMEGELNLGNPVYVFGKYPGTKEFDDGTKVYTYDAIIDGKLGTLMSKERKPELEKEGLVIPEYDGKYVAKVYTIAEGGKYLTVDKEKATCLYKNNTVYVDALDGTYSVADDCVAYIYNADGRGSLDVVKAQNLNGLDPAYVTLVATAVDKVVHYIYYIYR